MHCQEKSLLHENLSVRDGNLCFAGYDTVELAKKHGITLDKKKMSLPVPIKSYGRFTANVALFSGIVGKITVEVTSKQ
jgi:ribosomal protein L9